VRIYIVGGPGSGKTALAEALGRRLAVHVVLLDDVWSAIFARDANGGTSREADAFRRELVSGLLARPDWVVEGAEPPFLDALAEASDVIVWCDAPFALAAYRMIRRHVVAEIRRRNRYPGYRRLYRFIRSVRRRYQAPAVESEAPWTKWTRAAVAAAVPRYESKVVRLTSGSLARSVSVTLDAVARARSEAGSR
jgi:adenylate kinase family enzyme